MQVLAKFASHAVSIRDYQFKYVFSDYEILYLMFSTYYVLKQWINFTGMHMQFLIFKIEKKYQDVQ